MTKKDLQIINDLLKRVEKLPEILHLRAAPLDYDLTEKDKELLLGTYQKLDDILKEVAAFINVKFPGRQDYINSWNKIDFDTKIGDLKIITTDREHIKREWKKGLFDLTNLIKTLRNEATLLIDNKDEEVLEPANLSEPNMKVSSNKKNYYIKEILIGIIITVIGGVILDKIINPNKLESDNGIIIDDNNVKHEIENFGFDKNPSDKTGIVSIFEGDCSECGGLTDEIEINLPNSGDSTNITVFLDFMALRNSKFEIDDARAYYMTKNTIGTSQKFKFFASLTGKNVKRISDYSVLKGLPSSYSIKFIGGFIENEHGGKNPKGYFCDEIYDYKYNIVDSLFTSNGQNLGKLSNAGNSWCAQGTISAFYTITNTEKQ